MKLIERDVMVVSPTGVNAMNAMQVRGTLRGLAGWFEEETGKILGNPDLQRRGRANQIFGQTERLTGSASILIKAAIKRQ
jgi:uncharacterized protein YjbJ (UPF0337 family)